MSRIAAALLVFGVAAPAQAQLFNAPDESPRHHSFEIKLGPYTPAIDSEPGLTRKPYAAIFGEESMIMTKFEYDYQFWQAFGSLAVGFEFGFGSVTGNGIEVATGAKSSDETTLWVFPLSLSLVYHMDVPAVRYGIPLVPYAKIGFDYAIFWIKNGVGDTARFTDGSKALGGTFGWHVAVGLKVLLDFFAPSMARIFDVEVGVNNSYIFAEFLYADISDFGSSSSFRLGDTTFLAGIAFEF